MPAKVTYRKSLTRTAARKRSRVVKKASLMPMKGSFVVRGTSSDNKIKTFRFSVLSLNQQLRERNKAYHFFSID